MKRFDDSQVIAILRDAIEAAGSQKLFSQKHSISEQYICDVLRKRRGIGDKILKALNLKKVVHYERD